MAKAVIDAVSVVSQNLKKTVAFYKVLGFDFEGEGAFLSDEHIEPVRRSGEPRLMIDSARLIEEITGEKPTAPSHPTFAMKCDTPAEVDALVQEIKDAGYSMRLEPWDAFWGQRYASAKDPDGYIIDLFAELG